MHAEVGLHDAYLADIEPQRQVLALLAIKQPFCEIDEFDRRERNVLNFGHSFGHAIEAATDFAVPHGIGVTMGMDVALEVARGVGRIADGHAR